MFSKLRNRVILIAMLTSSIVLFFAFLAIFIIEVVRSSHMRPIPEAFNNFGVTRLFEKEMRAERDARLVSLAFTLFSVGVLVEVVIFVLTYYFADRIIEPVKKSYDSQREFIANASHELKTPIAAVQANFEALGATEQPWVDNIEAELNRANVLVSDLLTLARTDGRAKSKPEKTDLAALIKKRCKLIEARLGEKRLEMDLSGAVQLGEIELAQADFAQIMDILLDNAIKYSDKKIQVDFSEKCLSITNDGRTIPKDKLERVFERFYQTDKTAKGSGLGLSIAKSVANNNGWSLWAESGKKFTKFILKIN